MTEDFTYWFYSYSAKANFGSYWLKVAGKYFPYNGVVEQLEDKYGENNYAILNFQQISKEQWQVIDSGIDV